MACLNLVRSRVWEWKGGKRRARNEKRRTSRKIIVALVSVFSLQHQELHQNKTDALLMLCIDGNWVWKHNEYIAIQRHRSDRTIDSRAQVSLKEKYRLHPNFLMFFFSFRELLYCDIYFLFIKLCICIQ